MRRPSGPVAAAVIGLLLALVMPGAATAEDAAEPPALTIDVLRPVVNDVATIRTRQTWMGDLVFWFDDGPRQTMAASTSVSWADVDTSNLAEGVHVLHGESNGASAEATITVDHTAPSLSVVPTDGEVDDHVFYPQLRPAAWHVSATDGSAVSVTCRSVSSGGAQASGVCANDSDYTPSLSLGTYELTVTAVDAAGNTTTFAQPFTYALHPDAPTILGSSVVASDATFAFSSIAPDPRYECLTDTAPTWTPCTSPVTYRYDSSADHTFGVRVVYADGTIGPSNAQGFTVDLSAPYFLFSMRPQELVGPTDGSLRWSFVRVEAHPGQAPTLCSLTLASTPAQWSPCPSESSFNGFPTAGSGVYALRVKAIDAVGNEGTSVDTFTYDATAPVVVVSSPVRRRAHQRVFTLRADASAISQRCRLDAGAWVSCAGQFVASGLRDGSHTLVVQAADALGNVATIARSFAVDDTVPVFSFHGRPPRTVHLHGKKRVVVTIRLRSSEPTTFFCRLDGGVVHRCTRSAPPTTSTVFKVKVVKGAHHIKVYGVDRSGNRGGTVSLGWVVKR